MPDGTRQPAAPRLIANRYRTVRSRHPEKPVGVDALVTAIPAKDPPARPTARPLAEAVAEFRSVRPLFVDSCGGKGGAGGYRRQWFGRLDDSFSRGR